MDGRRARTPSPVGISLSQLIMQLEQLHPRDHTSKLKDTVGKRTSLGQKLPPSIPKIFLPTLNSKCNLSTGSATCCSPLDPTLLQGQLQRHQPDPKCYKALRSWSHHSKRKHLCIPRSNQGDSGDIAQSEIPLRITPAMVTHHHGLSDRRRADGRGTRNAASSSYCSAPNRFDGLGAGTSNGSSTGQSSSSSLFMDFPSDDSDLSDQERTSVTAQEWAAPVELDLRPEPFDKDDPSDYLDSKEDQLSYPEVLPEHLKIPDLFNRVDWERRHDLYRQDPSMYAIVSRLVEMERMQMATIQRERTFKVGRSRSSTAINITRSTTRIRKFEFLGSQPEMLVPGMEPGGGCPSVLSGLADLTLSHTSMARRRSKTACMPSKQSHDTRGSNVNLNLPKQPHSSSTSLSKITFLSGQSDQGLLLKAYKVDRLKGSNKVTSRLKRKPSSTRKKTIRLDIKR
ncbi:hypothetical protein SKAU_G00379630 [Synaphobranchus kaupii]|uniref:Uncharacterized protein n=1 Tax=Synaphobranchus kaupii TaxID=118154 RepID=A0A9Q1EDE1_SYNKA|nr:hypothetical protein SKAU_G00379630 [Synaphobranchus kaupii]